MMLNILLRDDKNKLMQQMSSLRDETELLICENINTIKQEGHQLNIETLSDGVTDYWLRQGYEIDRGLYDRLIIEYNQTHDKLLTRWK